MVSPREVEELEDLRGKIEAERSIHRVVTCKCESNPPRSFII
jgi:hypothetical protein